MKLERFDFQPSLGEELSFHSFFEIFSLSQFRFLMSLCLGYSFALITMPVQFSLVRFLLSPHRAVVLLDSYPSANFLVACWQHVWHAKQIAYSFVTRRDFPLTCATEQLRENCSLQFGQVLVSAGPPRTRQTSRQTDRRAMKQDLVSNDTATRPNNTRES